jgi:hypothetical protein
MHYTEDDLILYYYGEHRRRARIDRHLAACPSCQALFREIAASLAIVPEPAIPSRDERYGLEVWQRIRHQLPEQDSSWWPWEMSATRLGLAGAALVLLLAAFAAGRFWPAPPPPAAPVSAGMTLLPADAGERVRVAAVGDHLEQSERVLLDFINADGTDDAPVDVTAQQQWASDLIMSNRLYRDASAEAGDEPVAALLDELERNLLELVHGPASLTAADLDEVRTRLDAAALLFRVRVLSDDLRERELAPLSARNTL